MVFQACVVITGSLSNLETPPCQQQKLIEIEISNNVPCYLENPLTSKLFLAPPIKRLLSSPHCVQHKPDYCQYGTAWRKSTLVAAWHMCSDCPCKRCFPQGNCCSKTGKPHIHLQGKLTKLAAAYPKPWARQFAQTIHNSIHNNIHSRLCHLSLSERPDATLGSFGSLMLSLHFLCRT